MTDHLTSVTAPAQQPTGGRQRPPGRFLHRLHIRCILHRPIRRAPAGIASNGILTEPGKVFDLELPLDEITEAYRAMDERRATEVLVRP